MKDLLLILKQYWGYDAFRPVQEEAVRSVLDGHDTLVLLPTGGGKSLCFQVPTLAMDGVCIVVTPLIALMKDQVEQLKRRHIPAAAIHAGMNRREIDIVLDNCIHGNLRFLYVSPERLRTDIMIARVQRMNVVLLAIDEAHCISAWGYDFRPAYLLISEFRTLLPGVPVMALTASATPDVEADILEKLLMKQPRIFRQSFARKNLSYSAFQEDNKERKLMQVLTNVPGTSIVYVRTRKRTQQIAEWLGRQGIKADFYHAGLPFRDRTDRQIAWQRGQLRVIVATNAFGMGIDKPDVRSVVHLDLPDSLEAYYQEAGRAGRDGQKAYAVALYNDKDLDDLQQAVERKYPTIDLCRRVYQALANYFKIPLGGGEFISYSFDMHEFTGTFGLPVSETHFALKLLQEEGFIQLSEAFNDSSKLHFLVDNRQLYDFQIRYPDYDSFLKLILRMYGGELFSEYVRISEGEIARAFYVPIPEVMTRLQFLQERTIIDYEKQRNTPQLTYLTPRFDAELLPLNTYEIEKRKERDFRKVAAVIHYAQHPSQCRTLLLLNYFNEQNGTPCGVCDACLKRLKSQAVHELSTELVDDLLVYLQKNGPLLPQTFQAAFEKISEKELLAAVRKLLDEERIIYDNQGKIGINPAHNS
ncbi:RecQ family ATP-dependent DNA helicase [Arundinibacter roseus]|uniref:ATP-dependent DNA helicase RecQ n=1 Tax=Arundinibacter roseus TaxID=2070510 RepID=A0A4R4KQ34_9BACT|nr:ATP-dependent DNA helicase RecQ [Arundinibacter roseus]TDB69012.1 RecQ family ATP-dependent DNA helicase [Arundinibacter roseus]